MSGLCIIEYIFTKNYNEMILFGYFQSPKYFEKEKDKIFSMIGIPEFKEQIKNENPHSTVG